MANRYKDPDELNNRFEQRQEKAEEWDAREAFNIVEYLKKKPEIATKVPQEFLDIIYSKTNIKEIKGLMFYTAPFIVTSVIMYIVTFYILKSRSMRCL